MYNKLENIKVFRDPLYGNIQVEYQIIIDLINTLEMQRLRRIRQLSGVSLVFHTAEHSRFSHSLGTYEMARRVLALNNNINTALSNYEHILLLTSALLHDLGHGPFSHAFENVFSIPHETMSIKLINSNTEVNKVLSSYDKNLIKDISEVLSYKSKYKVVTSLVSSQIDVDRMDYLSRDAYFTGAKYGFIDYERIIKAMNVVNNELVFKESGVHTIESYLMSRYHMYWQVYYHPTARAYEIILESIYKRIKILKSENYNIEADVEALFSTLDNHDIKSYIELDDAYINGMIKQLIKSKDKILADLCNRFINRRLFKYRRIDNNTSTKEINSLISKYENNELLKTYYYSYDTVKQSAYLLSKTSINETKILLKNGETTTLSNYSNIVDGLINSGQKIEEKIFYGDIDV